MNFIFKYKLYHLPFWFAYHYMWWTLTIGSASQVFDKIFYTPYAFKFLFAVVFQAIGVYFNLYFLVPRFFEKGSYFSYIGWLLLTVLCTAAFSMTGYYAAAAWSEKTFEELFHMSRDNYLYIFKVNALPSTVASMTLALSVKLAKNWIQARQKQQVLEKEKLETELKFLRSQFNPHFLFNTINSIFVLINKDQKVARDSLAKFSGLLRYQLYECNEHEIPVSQELRYLINFIELEQLRLDSAHLDLSVEMEEAHCANLSIAPFLLMPFVENAFKHLPQQRTRRHTINIHIQFDGNRLQFEIRNSASRQTVHTRAVMPYSGIGLKNVQRRLCLLYPNAHQLTIKHDDHYYQVTLWLELREQKPAIPHMAVKSN